ncbi:MAG: hypothetical protein U0768_09710 [Anaerolineae bacterium]
MPIVVERESDGSYVVSDTEFLVYGNGETLAEAMGDYRVSLVELYNLVEADAGTGDPISQAQLDQLHTYLEAAGLLP